MKRYLLVPTVFVLAVLVFTFASPGHAARNVPIQNYGNTNLSTYGAFTAAQVGDAIISGGASIGWRMNKVSPELITATVTERSHSVTVEIQYSAKEYTIKYRDSVNMRAEGGTIHSSYNRWVERLQRNIDAQILRMKK
ncbi:MAG: hypothetical protein FWH34_00185 [Desulfovibrionaceae bacterium]|nr:hypothetical protein [Desulfovibrionaceae bacterium]